MRHFFLAAALLAFASPAFADATVGAPAPDFQLTDIDGKAHSLGQYKGKVVVLEWNNPNCPFVKRHAGEKTMVGLHDKYKDVVWIAVNSTRADHGEYMSPKDEQAWAKKNGITYPIAFDSDGKVAKAYGAKTTPHMFVIDKEGKVAYNGAIDDDPSGKKKASERKNYVDAALASLASGKAVAETTSKPYGCGVKYKD